MSDYNKPFIPREAHSSTIRLELGINAQKMIQQIQLNNHAIEESLEEGINLALKDLTEKDTLTEIIRQEAKAEILKIVRETVNGWELRTMLQDTVRKSLGDKMQEYADQVAEELTKSFSLLKKGKE